MKVACEHCGRQYRVADDRQGRTVKCKNCGQAFVIAPLGEELKEPPEPQHEEPAAEIFQPSTTYADTPLRCNKPAIPVAGWIAGGVALIIVVVVIMHPWCHTDSSGSTSVPNPLVPPPQSALQPSAPAAPAPAELSGVRSVSAQTVIAGAGWKLWELGPYIIEVPQDFPPAEFMADGTDPAFANAPTADKARYGVLFWNVSKRWPDISYFKFITSARADHSGDLPEIPSDINTGQQRQHDTKELAGLTFLRVFYFDQPQRYLAYDSKSQLEIHVDAKGSVPADAMEILDHMAGSVRRVQTDLQPPPPAKWELTQKQQLPGGLQVMLPAGAHVEEVVAGLGIFEATVRKPDSTEIKLTVKNAIQPQQQFDEEINASNSSDGSTRVQWMDINGFHLAKIVLKDLVTHQEFSVGYAGYQQGRHFAIGTEASFTDPDASNLLDAIAQSLQQGK